MRGMCIVAAAAVILALGAAGCVKPARIMNQDGRYQEALEPYPDDETDTWGCLAGRVDALSARVEMGREGDVPVKAIVVDGYTEMPDDSDVIVAIRPLGNRLYKTWADVVARGHRLHTVLGPFREEQLPTGSYVVEVMWLAHRQHPSVRAQANVQDSNMKHRMRDMDMDHRSSKIVWLPVATLPPEPEPVAPAEGTAPAEGETPAEGATPAEGTPPAEGTKPAEEGTKPAEGEHPEGAK